MNRIDRLRLNSIGFFEPTEYDRYIYRLACYYMAQTEEYDRTLSSMRCKHDKTEAFLPTSSLRKISYTYCRYLWEILDPYYVLRQDIQAEINKHTGYTAQHWIDEYHLLLDFYDGNLKEYLAEVQR